MLTLAYLNKTMKRQRVRGKLKSIVSYGLIAIFVVVAIVTTQVLVNAQSSSRINVKPVVLYSFNDGNDGKNPDTGLVQGSDGFLYGVAAGGTQGKGIVFRVDTEGKQYKVVHTFAGGAQGDSPYGTLVEGAPGTFYGTTLDGGTEGKGTIFTVTSTGNFEVLYSIGSTADDPGELPTGIVLGNDGYLYGVTGAGGAYGTYFRISPLGAGYTILYDFHNAYVLQYEGGFTPQGKLVQGVDNTFYGVTREGGNNPFRAQGTLYSLPPGPVVNEPPPTLYSFSCQYDKANGCHPLAGPIIDSNGENLYGTTNEGGANNGGTIYKYSLKDKQLITLHSFSAEDGSYNTGSSLLADDNYLYGTAYNNAHSQGIIYRISAQSVKQPDGTENYIDDYKVISTLIQDPKYPQQPKSGLIEASDGNFYGTSVYGGNNNAGTVYMVDRGAIDILDCASQPITGELCFANRPCSDKLIQAVRPEDRGDARVAIPLLLDTAKEAGITDKGQIAYILATAERESRFGRQFYEKYNGASPIAYFEGKYGSDSKKAKSLGNTQLGDGFLYRGRGYVHLTGRTGYTKWGEKLKLDLINFPDTAAIPRVAAAIAVYGMRDGTFTGKKLSNYINGSKQDFFNARRIINGTDVAKKVADRALVYYNILQHCQNFPEPVTTDPLTVSNH